MIVVDTSVWIDYFNGQDTPQTNYLDNALGNNDIAIGDLILLEILQGFRQDKQYRQAKTLLSTLTTLEMLGTTAAIQYATYYRTLRKKGITIRKTADVIIAGYCIKNKVPLLYADKDFDPFVEYIGLIKINN